MSFSFIVSEKEFSFNPYFKIKYFKEVDSTNKVIKRFISDDSDDLKGLTVISDFQSAGIGRNGRTFFSPPGCGLYLSVLLPADTEIMKITAAAGAAVKKAINDIFKIDASIKWLNDIYKDGKKIAGILAQAVNDNRGGVSNIILGIGINLVKPEDGFPPGIIEKATYIKDYVTKEEYLNLISGILDNIYNYCILKSDFRDEYKSSEYLIGKKIKVVLPDRSFYATALKTDELFRLVVLTETGEKLSLGSGEVTIIPQT